MSLRRPTLPGSLMSHSTSSRAKAGISGTGPDIVVTRDELESTTVSSLRVIQQGVLVYSSSYLVRMSDTPDGIRSASAQLSDMFVPSSADSAVPRIATSAHVLGSSGGKAREALDTMRETDEERAIGIATRQVSPVRSSYPSGLSRVIAQGRSREGSTRPEEAGHDGARTPIAMDECLPGEPSDSPVASTSSVLAEGEVRVVGERAGLLGGRVKPAYSATSRSSSVVEGALLDSSSSVSVERRLPWKSYRAMVQAGTARAKELATPGAVKAGLAITATTLPAVVLGMLLNILDGVSYGMIMFPAGEMFDGFAGLGVSIFFVTTFVSQIVYTFGGSAFAGANGSMMIEVVPFFHILAAGIIAHVGEDNPHVVVATTMVAFCLSSILTGFAFLLMGFFRLGFIMEFFPRHILVGCIGGVGVFLIETGFEVAARINDDDGFQYNMDTFRKIFMNTHSLALWVPAFGLAVLLRVITHRVHHQLVFPAYFILVGVMFYIVVTIVGVDLATLRNAGWVFDVGGSREPWYEFYSKFDLRQTSWSAIWAGIPTQLALLFFNMLHPPLNVPALAVSLNEDNIDTNRELKAHGMSNLLAGLVGAAPNYLVYVNTLLFYRVGGGTRYAGFLLACSTVVLLWIGTGPIGYIPVMVVGALIFVLGLDLVKESVWDTRHRVSTSEYVTIVAIMLCMSLYDFVIGVLFGIVLACFFFVVQNSKRLCIRALYYGDTAMSTVRRPSAHRQYIREVACQTAILRLQGMIFFGSVTYVESTIRQLLDVAQWNKRPIRFLIVDLSLVGGLDMSSAEAFVRVQRLLATKRVTLIVCGVSVDSAVGKALQQVDIWAGRGLGVEVFGTLNEAMEWTENAYLRTWFAVNGVKEEPQSEPVTRSAPQETGLQPPIPLGTSLANSPRRSHLIEAGQRIMTTADEEGRIQLEPEAPPREPTCSLIKAFSSHTDDPDLMAKLAAYFIRVELRAGDVLWRQGEVSDGLYVIESGVLQASYQFAAHSAPVQESMTAGTLAGELSALSGSTRNATVVAERPSIVWKMSAESYERLEKEQGEVAKAFVTLVLKAAKQDYDVLLAALATRH